ncbi:MAG TPA: type II toxin-antitoxin system VapC family toxin [bacterium]|jgi:predicted nucleic acid-binding protein|nr:type II toxin-antitoxin system VapC family toxin [bacterium]
MIVIDTNVLAYKLLPESDAALRDRAKRLLEGDERILVPTLWRHEFLNILSGYLRAGLLDVEKATGTWYEACAFVESIEAEVDMARALELSKALGVTGYDAQFLALAEGANTVLVTEDKRLLRAAAGRAVSMREHLAAR